ncbi:MAG TPA: hypothetical protein VLB01_00775 [Thermodesulfobacteriota bacterium]|nr:hypothetical protein [Thermodesulfobacteriota bacterium]
MKDVSKDMALIEKEFENLILTSKLYITSREKEELSILQNNIDVLQIEMDKIMGQTEEKFDPNILMVLNRLNKVISKFQTAVQLLENIKSEKPLYPQLDVRRMLDMLLENIRSLIYTYSNVQSINVDKLEADLQTIESLEEQNKRILITYLMQDWKNLKEVLTLIKIGEIYKDIAEKLVDISILMNTSGKQ